MATKLQKASIALRQNKGRDLSPRWDGADDWDGEKFTRHFYTSKDLPVQVRWRFHL